MERRGLRRRSSPAEEASFAGGLNAVRRALLYLRSYKGEAAAAFVSLLLASAANLTTPLLIRLAIDEGIAPRRLDVILLAVGGLWWRRSLRGLFTFLQGYLAERASQGVAYDLRDALFAKIERLGFAYYDRVETGQLVTRLTSDVEQIRTFAGSGVVQLAAPSSCSSARRSCSSSSTGSSRSSRSPIVPVIAVLLVRFVRRIGPLFRQVQQTLGQAQHRAAGGPCRGCA